MQEAESTRGGSAGTGMRKTVVLLAYVATLVAITMLVTWLFTDKTWQQGLADGAISLVCATLLGVVLIWWVPKKRRDWGLDENDEP